MFEAYADAGFDLVVATSFGLGAVAAPVAEAHPATKFLHVFGSTLGSTQGNWANVRPSIYQAIFVSGFVGGLASGDSAKHCYLAPMRFPEVLQAVDAFTLGVQRARGESVEVDVSFIGSWFDTELETAASRMLLDRGCDVLGLYTDTPLPLRIFSQAGKLGVGCKSDMSLKKSSSGNTVRDPNVLVSAVYSWDTVYELAVRALLNNTWPSGWEITGGMADDLVSISSISPLVPMEAATAADALAKRIRGNLTDAFSGPIYDVDGVIRVAQGVTLPPENVSKIDWFVRGVVDLGDFSLVQCNAGGYIFNGTCIDCPIGSFSSESGVFSCTPCPAGNTSTIAGATSCEACPAGTFKASAGAGSCEKCSAGRAASERGSTTCELCPAGSIAPNSGSAECGLCEVGTYSNTTGALGCTRCPEHSTTAQSGASSVDLCRCNIGYQQTSAAGEPLMCVSGKVGTNLVNTSLGVAGGIVLANILGLAAIIFFIVRKTEA